jgi:transposase
MIRSLPVARQTAIRARTQAINAIKALLVTAPVELREQLRDLPAATLVAATAALAPGPITSPLAAARLALGTLAHRHQALTLQIKTLTAELDRLTATAAPELVALFGVGQDSAGALLVTAGDNPSGSAARPASRCCVVPHRSRRPPARPSGTASTEVVTARPTPRCTGSCCYDYATTSRPRTT